MSAVKPRPIREYALGIFDGPHATPKESQEGAVFLGIKNITDDGRLDLSEIRYVSEEEFPRWTKRVTPQPGDVVLTYEATLHRYAIIPEGFRGCLGRRVALVRPDPKKADSRFLLYYFLSHGWRQVVEKFVITGATVDRIPLEKFPEFPVALPDVQIQKRVASVLGAYDNLIENNRRRMALLEDAVRLLYEEWFARLQFPGHEHTQITNGVPDGWERTRLGGLCRLRAGDVFKPKYQGQINGDVPFIKVRDLGSSNNLIAIVESDNWVTVDECEDFRGQPFSAGTVVFAKIGEALRKNRVRFLIRETLIDNNLMGAVPIREDDWPLLYVLLAHYDFGANASGAAVPFLSAKVLSEERFLIPSEVIRRQFNEIVRAVLQQCATLQRQSAEAAKARDLLLPRLIGGEIAA